MPSQHLHGPEHLRCPQSQSLAHLNSSQTRYTATANRYPIALTLAIERSEKLS